ncbi:MAG: PH domain-containing protein [bacterium]
MKYETYGHVGLKTFFLQLLKNNVPTIFLSILWFIVAIIKIEGAQNIIPLSDSSQLTSVINAVFTLVLVGGVALILITFVIIFLLTLVDYYSFYFMLDENGLRMQKGILFKREISIPYRQVQDITIDRPFTFQLCGVCRLNILTAGQDNDHDNDPTEANFPIIDRNLAEELRKELLTRANVERVRKA